MEDAPHGRARNRIVLAHRAKKWTRFFAPTMHQLRAEASDPKSDTSFGSDALAGARRLLTPSILADNE